MNKEENVLVVITWVSGSWKTTACKKLLRAGYTTPYSFATREPRGDYEKDEYVFLTGEQFKEIEDGWRLAESVTYGDSQYWASAYWYEWRTFLILEPHWREQIKKVAEEGKLFSSKGEPIDVEVVTVYINIDKGTQHKRLVDRGDSQAERGKRLKDFDTFAPTKNCLVLDWTTPPLLLAKQIDEYVNDL